MKIQKINGTNNISATSRKIDNDKCPNKGRKKYSLPKTDISKCPSSVIRNNISSTRQKLLSPISCMEEYYFRLMQISKYEKQYKGMYYEPYINFNCYDNADLELRGLVPYCGVRDISEEINCWLTGRNPKDKCILSDEEMANIVRVLDFSLNNLDEKYGKYEGVLFRTGFFNPITDKQYYSTSSTAQGAVKHSNIYQNNDEYSIIYTKSGHKISDFQADCGNNIAKEFSDSENEILIDRKTNFRRKSPEEYTDEDIKKIRELIKQIYDYTDNENELSPEITNRISIWEEI